MSNRAVVETSSDRKALVADAGFGRLSFASAVAGVLAAYGAFAVLAGVVAGVIDAADVDIDITRNWRDLGLGGGLIVAGLLLLAYLFGGYVAGRMARRAGLLHGLAVFVLGVAVVAIAAFITRQLGGADTAISNLRDLGVPTTGSEWGEILTVAGLASLLAMLVGAVGGGILGERWHTKLVSRALDPRVGAEAEAYREAEQRAAEAEELRLAGRDRHTDAVQRVRGATPTRTQRVDTDAVGTPVVRSIDADADIESDTDTVARPVRRTGADAGADTRVAHREEPYPADVEDDDRRPRRGTRPR